MGILLRIAFRNLREHKAKTIIVGVLIGLGVLLLIIGNSFLATASTANERLFVNNFTGHVMIRAKGDAPISMMGTPTVMTGMDMPASYLLPNYRDVYAYLEELDGIKAMNPQLATYFSRMDFSTEQENKGSLLPLFGIDPDAYQNMFPNSLAILEGRFLEQGEQGLLLHSKIRDDLKEELDIDVQPGDTVKVQTTGRTGSTRIRNVTVVGIYEFVAEASSMDGVSLMDAQTLRELMNLTVGTSEIIDIDAADTMLLDSNFDNLFDTVDDLVVDDAGAASDSFFDPDALFSYQDDEQTLAYTQIDSGAWAYILLMLEDSQNADAFIAALNEDMVALDWNVEATDWDAATGGVASMLQGFQIFFLIIVALITFVSIIIIMNTLVISVVERTAEIGTMRALGARRSRVRTMFVMETMSISFIFGGLGLILGIILMSILGYVGFPAPNLFFEQLFGASLIKPTITTASIVQALLMMTGVGLLSSLYPVSVALRIQPVQAMQSK